MPGQAQSIRANAKVACCAQAGLWAFLTVSGRDSEGLSRILSCTFLAAVSLLAAAGFLLYGGRLFLMLRRWGPSALLHASQHQLLLQLCARRARQGSLAAGGPACAAWPAPGCHPAGAAAAVPLLAGPRALPQP